MMNYHFHDERSSDGRAPLLEHCTAAVAAGFRDICLTNHVETLQPDGTWAVDLEEALRRFESVCESVLAVRRQLPSLRLRFGAEFAFRPDWLASLETLAAELPFDFVLGSLHDVDGVDVSGPAAGTFYETRTREAAYARYFDALGELVAWGGCDVVAHFDLVKRFGHRSYGPYDASELEDRIRPVLNAMARKGLGIEVNTSGIVQAPRAPYPERELLDWALASGVPLLTVGSDSHAPAQFGQGIREGLAIARAAGWTTLTTFEGREPSRRLPIQDALAALEAAQPTGKENGT